MTGMGRHAAVCALAVAIALGVGQVAAAVSARGAGGTPVVLAAQSDLNAALPPAEPAPPPGAITGRVSALRDTRGLHPGLTAVRASERVQARRLIGAVRAARPNATIGYDRDLFGSPWTDNQTATWGGDRCSTRENVLRRDMRTVTVAPGGARCDVRTGVLADPYTATTIPFSKQRPSEVQIDHVIALSYGWQQGASRWTTDKRKQIANDPLNLLAVDGPTNQSKGDQGPGEWLPPNVKVHCAFAVRFAHVSIKYRVPVQPADKRVMLRVCGAQR